MKQLERLRAIQLNIEEHPDALALIALGSVGPDRQRLDQYSDIDFFLIVSDGTKATFLEHPEWLEVPDATLSYLFRYCENGFKLMYDDGIFAEQRVWQESEVADIVSANGEVLWSKEGFFIDARFGDRVLEKLKKEKKSLDYHFHEALTHIYVGLNRYVRGERLAGSVKIQYHALSHLLHTLPFMGCSEDGQVDMQNLFRRAEKNYPKLSSQLSPIFAGVDHTPEAAEAVLAFLEKHWTPNETVVEQIQRLLKELPQSESS